MKLAIALATRGRPELLKATVEKTLANVGDSRTRLWVLMDADDPCLAALNDPATQLVSGGVGLNIAAREDTLGGKFNRILKLEPDADVYLAMVDYAPHVTPRFDVKILEAASHFPDGIGVVYGARMANLSFPQINAVTRKLCEKMSYMYPPYWTYWFIDHWLDDIARMIDRIALADVVVDDSARPGTMDRRDPVFWSTLYDALKTERWRLARYIIQSPDFQEPEWRKGLLLSGNSIWSLIDQRSYMVNNSVRGNAATWAANNPPEPYDERYGRARNAGIGMLRYALAEMEAEAATKKINQAAA
jgi:hypothetical protein